MSDFYEILGVPRDAGADSIKKAYRRLALRYHPDRNEGSLRATERFREVTEAFDTLRRPDRRALYDRFGRAGVAGGEGSAQGGSAFELRRLDLTDALDLFVRHFSALDLEEVFSHRGGSGQETRRRTAPRASIRISASEAAAGVLRTIPAPCSLCLGGGLDATSVPSRCQQCGGLGQLRNTRRSVLGPVSETGACPACGGRGGRLRRPCSGCDGSGLDPGAAPLRVVIPAGAADGAVLRTFAGVEVVVDVSLPGDGGSVDAPPAREDRRDSGPPLRNSSGRMARDGSRPAPRQGSGGTAAAVGSLLIDRRVAGIGAILLLGGLAVVGVAAIDAGAPAGGEATPVEAPDPPLAPGIAPRAAEMGARLAPARPPERGGFVVIAPGVAHACGITWGGEAFCWGSDERQQLGIRPGENGAHAPGVTPVSGGFRFDRIGAGLWHTCGLTGAGEVLCWGGNDGGQLGDGTRVQRGLPEAVRLRSTAVDLAVGWRHACALDRSGTALCWGRNHAGQLGDGSRIDRDVPFQVLGGRRFSRIAAGSAHTCALSEAGEVFCWGAALVDEGAEDRSGETAGDLLSDPSVPRRIALPGRAIQIAAGAVHSCALLATGSVRCWGRNSYGQLGDDTLRPAAEPIRVSGVPPFASIMAAGAGTCGVTAAGEVHCWGRTDVASRGSIVAR